MYLSRNIDKYLSQWADSADHKPVLLRGARQVGKSSSVRHLGQKFESFVEVNFERKPVFKSVFAGDLDVERIVSQLSAICGESIRPGSTLLFLDEIQECPEAIMALRFFREDLPQLHVIAAGSLLEFVLNKLPTFGVGRIHSMFMRPLCFDEFLEATGEQLLLQARNACGVNTPLAEPLYQKMVRLFREYIMVGGMPEAVCKWVTTHDFLQCQQVQDDILISYEDDFAKYKKRADVALLRATLRSVAAQLGRKFVYSAVGSGYKSYQVSQALELLSLAGLIIPVAHTNANGLPLGSEVDANTRKFFLLDSGILLRLFNIAFGDIAQITTDILTATAADLVNKGQIAEQIACTELLSYKTPNTRNQLYYWTSKVRNSVAEIDFIDSYGMKVLPIEVKAGVQGGMKSLWAFMREKRLHLAARCSLENFGTVEYHDAQACEVRCAVICPLYAMSMMKQCLQSKSDSGSTSSSMSTSK